MKKILCVVTNNNVKGATGIPTGFFLVKENDLDNWGVGGKTLAQFLAEQKK